jgi:hypothetical protein
MQQRFILALYGAISNHAATLYSCALREVTSQKRKVEEAKVVIKNTAKFNLTKLTYISSKFDIRMLHKEDLNVVDYVKGLSNNT